MLLGGRRDGRGRSLVAWPRFGSTPGRRPFREGRTRWTTSPITGGSGGRGRFM